MTSLVSQFIFVSSRPFDFATRLCSDKGGIDAAAKLYVAGYNAASTFLPDMNYFPDFTGNLNKSSELFIKILKCSSIPSKTREVMSSDPNRTLCKTVNVFFTTIVAYCDGISFGYELANAGKLGNTFKLFKNGCFVVACITGIYEKVVLIYDPREIALEEAHKEKWEKANKVSSVNGLRNHYQSKIDAGGAGAAKTQKWQKKIQAINSNTYTVAQFNPKVSKKVGFWESKKVNKIERYKNDLNCQISKLVSLVLDIGLTLIKEYGSQYVSKGALSLGTVIDAKNYLEMSVTLANLVTAIFNMHKTSFDLYFGKKAKS